MLPSTEDDHHGFPGLSATGNARWTVTARPSPRESATAAGDLGIVCMGLVGGVYGQATVTPLRGLLDFLFPW